MPAPAEPAALSALEAVQALSASELDQAITAEVGEPMLGAFNALAKSTFPGADDERIARAVHLMVLAFLMRSRAETAG